jgi:tungstate transport system ATP-binding protein
MLYSLRNLKKIYKGRTVLDVPELFLERNKIYGLLGPNGSGKTTLLHILSFLEPASSGTLFYEDKPVSFAENLLQERRREVILADQHPILFSTSVYKNVEFGLKVRKIPKRDRGKIVEECLDMVGMRNFAGADARHLSGGETQRAAIARALACSPKVMLFDEPTSSVDAGNQTAIENIIRHLHSEKGISVIFSTHDLFQASALADEKIFLFEGRPGASVWENIFNGRVISEESGKYCLINEKVSIPVKTDKEGNIKISVNPVSLKLGASGDGHRAELLKGKIFQVAEERGRVRVSADVGIRLSISLTRKEYTEQRICVGDHVMIRCPEYGIEVIG